MNNCGVRAVAALTKRPWCEIDSRIRADRERHGNTRRGMKNITRTYLPELMRVLQGYGYAVSSEWPRSHGYLHNWRRRHPSGFWLIRVGDHFLAKRARYWWNVLPGRARVTNAIQVTRTKGGRQ